MIYYLYTNINRDKYFVLKDYRRWYDNFIVGIIRVNRPIVCGNFYSIEQLCYTMS